MLLLEKTRNLGSNFNGRHLLRDFKRKLNFGLDRMLELVVVDGYRTVPKLFGHA